MDWFQILPGLGVGTFLGGVIGAVGNAYTSKASDKRKFAQNEISRQHQADQAEIERQHADKVRDEERMYEVAGKFASTAREVAMTAIDIDGIFNAIRDWALTATDTRDPNVIAKTEFATRQVKGVARLADCLGELQLVAPPEIISAAQKVSLAAQAQAQGMTQPLAAPVLTTVMGEAMADFVRIFRAETGREEYTESNAREGAVTLMDRIQEQVDEYLNEFNAEAKRRGYPVPRRTSQS